MRVYGVGGKPSFRRRVIQIRSSCCRLRVSGSHGVVARGSGQWRMQGNGVCIGPATANKSLVGTTGELRDFGTFVVGDVGSVGGCRGVKPVAPQFGVAHSNRDRIADGYEEKGVS